MAHMTHTSADSISHAPAASSLKGKQLHFVGIGGCGMSGLARMAKAQGAKVSGSDLTDSTTTQTLKQQGIDVFLDQSGACLPRQANCVVASAAISYDHPELLEARKHGIEVIKYAQMLGQLMQSRQGVAIAGTHGKSTTTSVLSHILIYAGLDPSFIVGAHCQQIGGGSRTGQSDILVAEACEFDRSFHHLNPTHAVVLNVEADHLDMYSGIDEIVESFQQFAQLIPEQGSLLIQHSSPHRMAITAGLSCKVETIGHETLADWRVGMKDGHVRLHDRDDKIVAQWLNPLPGEHMAYNCAVAAITAHRLGASWEKIAEAITCFKGLDRRMQLLGEPAGLKVIDDYGHHPTEVDTTLRALKQHHQPGRLICVFQPHQHSRTRFLMQQFATSFSVADIVIVPDIYFVRDSEEERHAVTAADLVDTLRDKQVTAMHLYPFAAIVEQLQVIAKPGDLIVTMGAGNVWQVGQSLCQTLQP